MNRIQDLISELQSIIDSADNHFQLQSQTRALAGDARDAVGVPDTPEKQALMNAINSGEASKAIGILQQMSAERAA